MAALLARQLLLIAALLCIAMSGASGQPTGVEHVFIVAVDGHRPDVLRNADTPNIDNLIGVGAYSWSARTISPSVTLPAHCSMVSGLLPEGHGVTWNSHRPSEGPLGVRTIFDIARERGLSTAAFVTKEKLRLIAPPEAVDACVASVVAAEAAAATAANHIAQHRPNLCLLHLSDVDSAGHAHGWGSPEQHAAMASCDRAVGLLLGGIHRAGIAGKSVMIVTSDHGGQGTGHVGSGSLDMTIPWLCAGTGVSVRHEIDVPVSICDTAAMALWALGIAPPDDWVGRIIPGVFPRRAAASETATDGRAAA